MIKVLFICHGNICRSPMAESILKHLASINGLTAFLYIDSAATSTEEIGNGVHYGTRNILGKKGVPCAEHRARQMTRRDYEEYNYLIGMDDANIRNMMRIVGGDPKHKMYKLLEFAESGRAIADPWYTGDFDTTYADVEEGCKALLKYLQENCHFESLGD